MLDFPARKIQNKPAPSNAGTKHLDLGPLMLEQMFSALAESLEHK
jgi:hypothetical protein